jgi:prolycopene isomerase
MIERFPSEAKGTKGFMDEMTGLNEEVERFFKVGKLTPLIKITFPAKFPRMWAARVGSLKDFLDKHIKDPEVKGLMSVFSGYYGLPPEKLSGFYYMNASGGYFRHGGAYPRGYSTAISEAIAEFIEARKGTIKYSTKVEKVLVEDGKAVGVKTANGEVIRSKAVVANCSGARLFNDMIPSDKVPADYLKKIRSYQPSMSSFLVWLGLNKDITDKIKDSHIFLQTEPDINKAFENCLAFRPDKMNIGVMVCNNVYKEYSPPGTTVVSLIALSGYEPWKPYEKDYFSGRKDAYHAKKRSAADTLIKRVEEKLIPGLSDMIAVKESATPLTNIRYTLNTAGAIYGWAQTQDNAYMKRISNRTPIKGLYLSGAWGEPGGGVAAVLISGRKTFGMVMDDWGKKG